MLDIYIYLLKIEAETINYYRYFQFSSIFFYIKPLTVNLIFFLPTVKLKTTTPIII